MIAYIYEISETTNSKINIEKLNLEIRTSPILGYQSPPYLFKGKVYIDFEQLATPGDKASLDVIFAAHDGAEAGISESLVNAREKKIRELTEMAIYHPSLSEIDVVEYLTSIDNWFNGWKRSGISTSLIAKISADATNGAHPQAGFLNTIINTEGNRTYEFLIGMIL